jgi:tRNA U34 5-methylaminomethyl-2-thiouridine-forming methyltransferase MnmC
MSDHLKIITTSDGSHSLLNTALNETYHSHHGAIQESLHVFIKHGLAYHVEQFQSSTVRIFEVGFGTGLNAFLTVQFSADRQEKFFYTSIEGFPLPESIWSNLNYAATADLKNEFQKLHGAQWNGFVEVSPGFELKKLHATLQEIELAPASFDVVFFDAFAPSKQPEMWEYPMLEKVIDSMAKNGVFVTYCAKGQLKRDLKNLGLQVETLPGPPGKKEMVRGLKI